MNYLIKWQFTKENPIPFKTQAEIVNSNLAPLSEDRFFQSKKFSFYITKVYLTNVRLAVFVEEKNLEELKKVILKYTKSLKLNPVDLEKPDENNSWDGCPEETPFTFSKGSSDCEEIFHTEYLEDITWIGIGLHKKDLTLAIPIVVRTAYETMRSGLPKSREILDQDFRETSEQYKKKNRDELNKFWSECGFYYKSGITWGPHFFYDIVLGIDPYNFTNPNTFKLPSELSPQEIFLKVTLTILRDHNIDTELPNDLQSSEEAIIFLINKALRDPQ